MNLTLETPAILFSAISLIMLAYTSRFLSVASLVRTLIKEHQENGYDDHLDGQIKYLRIRLHLIKNMQVWGVVSFLFALVCMFLVYTEQPGYANILFIVSVFTFAVSLVLSLLEIYKSTAALEIAIRDSEPKKREQIFE